MGAYEDFKQGLINLEQLIEAMGGPVLPPVTSGYYDQVKRFTAVTETLVSLLAQNSAYSFTGFSRYEDDFCLGSNGIYPWTAITNNGSILSFGSISGPGNLGVLRLRLDSGSVSARCVEHLRYYLVAFAELKLDLCFKLKLERFSDAGDIYSIDVGFGDHVSNTDEHDNGFWFRYDPETFLNHNWFAAVAVGGVIEYADTGIAASTTDYQNLQVLIAKDGDRVDYFIDNAQVWSTNTLTLNNFGPVLRTDRHTVIGSTSIDVLCDKFTLLVDRR